MITFTALTALMMAFVAFGWFAVRDVHRQTEAWSARHPVGSAVPLRRQPSRIQAVHGAAARWTALDDLQLARLLSDQPCR